VEARVSLHDDGDLSSVRRSSSLPIHTRPIDQSGIVALSKVSGTRIPNSHRQSKYLVFRRKVWRSSSYWTYQRFLSRSCCHPWLCISLPIDYDGSQSLLLNAHSSL